MADQEEAGFQYGKNRLKTFTDKGWKSSYNADPEALAAAGFIYEGNDDEVMCICCQIKLEGWEKGDVPIDEHRRMSEKCRFVVDSESCEGDLKVVCDKMAESSKDVVMFAPPIHEEPKCIRCLLNPREIVFQPCTHIIMCKICSSGVNKCPNCSTPILKRTQAKML